MIALIRRRPLFISGLALGLAIFAIAFRGEETRNKATKLEKRITVVESTSPCSNLTTSECALKLLRALPKAQRDEISVNEKTLHLLERQVRREREILRRQRAADNAPAVGASGDSPGRSPGGSSPSPAPQRPGSSPVVPNAPAPAPIPPAPPSSPITPPLPIPPLPDPVPQRPTITTPTITTPQVGPVPPVTVPSITVPTITIPFPHKETP